MSAVSPSLRSDERLHANQSLPARLMAIAHFAQKQVMEQLPQDHRLGPGPVHALALFAERERSPGELAEQLGVSKQACSKTLQELESAGLLRRRVNPEDSRSSVLSLSSRGTKLLRSGVGAANDIERQLLEATGAPGREELLAIFDRLGAAMDSGLPARAAQIEDAMHTRLDARPARLAILLPALARRFRERLSAALNQQRYSDLRPGVGQLFGLIGDQGRRLQTIASVLGVSKQAIAATAAELEALGYARRAEDPQDRRQVILSLSPRGRKLLSEVVAGVDALEAEIRAQLGDADYRLLDQTMTLFYAQITERYDRAGALRNRIRQLSQQLLDELGTTGAHALAQQLMAMTRGKY